MTKPRIVYTKQPPRNLRLYRFYVPAIALGLFLWLAHYSLGQDQGYTASERAALATLVAKSTKPSKGDIVMELYGITEADLARPVVLWKD